ncbi:MAG TPA: LuxR C-terminal-related transcriptional regulator, partial [Iamia sp.]
DVPPVLAAEVHDLTEGDVTFAAAAAAARRKGTLDDPSWLDEAVAPHLDGLRPDQRRLVLEIAPLAAVTAEMGDAITGRRDSAAVLAELARETTVVVAADASRPSYRLHRLVRRALVARLEADDPGRVAATHRAAAQWQEQHGDVEGAIDEWLAAGDEAAAWDLIAAHHVTTWFAGGREAIERWVDRLPTTSVPLDPQQGADRAALMLMVGRPDEASRWTEQAAAWADAAGRADELAPLVTYLRAQTHLLWGDLEGALTLHKALDRDRVGWPYVQLSAAAVQVEALAQLGRFDEARRAFLEMAPWAPFEGGMAHVIVPGVHASLLSCEGRLTEALALAADGMAKARDLVGPEGPGTAWSHLAVGTALLEQGQVHDAAPALVTAGTVARRSGAAHLVVRAAAALSRARWMQGRSAEAFDIIEAARRSPHLHPLPDPLPAWLDQAEARLHLLGGDAFEAQAVLGDRPDADQPQAVVLRAWAALGVGDRARAQDLLAEDLGPAASLGARIEADLLRVRSLRDPLRVRRHIGRAVHRGAVDGYLTVFLDHRDGVVEALHGLRGTEPSPYLTDLLFLLDAGDAVRLAEALTERELAVLTTLQSARSIEAIAADLEVSVNTLKTHVKAVYRKLEATTRADAVRRALALRLIGPAAHEPEGPVNPTAAAP